MRQKQMFKKLTRQKQMIKKTDAAKAIFARFQKLAILIEIFYTIHKTNYRFSTLIYLTLNLHLTNSSIFLLFLNPIKYSIENTIEPKTAPTTKI